MYKPTLRHPYANNFLKKNELWLPSAATISCDLVTFPSFLCFLVSCEMESNCIHFQHCWLGVTTCTAQRMLASGNRKCSCCNLMVIPSRKHHVWLLPVLRRSVKTRQGDMFTGYCSFLNGRMGATRASLLRKQLHIFLGVLMQVDSSPPVWYPASKHLNSKEVWNGVIMEPGLALKPAVSLPNTEF